MILYWITKMNWFQIFSSLSGSGIHTIKNLSFSLKTTLKLWHFFWEQLWRKCLSLTEKSFCCMGEQLLDKPWKIFLAGYTCTTWISMVLKEEWLKKLSKYSTYRVDLNYESCKKQCFPDFPKSAWSDENFANFWLA